LKKDKKFRQTSPFNTTERIRFLFVNIVLCVKKKVVLLQKK